MPDQRVPDGERVVVRLGLAYGDDYRFRLWWAVIEDSVALGMGFRTYLAHVQRTLDLSMKAGTKILNPSGKDFVLGALKEDDLWGFLGKKEKRPFGPKRRILDNKLAVLDAYFKIKNRSLADSFGKHDVPFELAAILRSFFEASNDWLITLKKDVEQLDGIYVPRPRILSTNIREALKDGRSDIFIIPIVIVRYRGPMHYVEVHKAFLPLQVGYLADEHVTDDLRRYIPHHSPKETLIFGGVGIPSPGIGDHWPRLSCILRDRATYEPHLTQLRITMGEVSDFDDGYKPHSAHEIVGHFNFVESFSYCGKPDYCDRLIRLLGYSKSFVERLIEFYDKTAAGA